MTELIPEPPEPAAEQQAAQRSHLRAGVGGSLAGLAILGGVAFAMTGASEPDTLATDNELASTVPTTVATTTTAPVFVDSTVVTVPTTIVETTTTTLPPTTSTTLAPTTTLPPTTTTTTLPELPAQPAQPIAPPPDPRGYEDQVLLGRIAIPKLGVDEPLLQGIRLTTLDNGPGHWPGTALPGQVGNVVVAGHRTSHGAVFRNIDQLVAGDVVEFDIGNGPLTYTVTGTEIVEPNAIWIINPTETPTATLFACHPPGSTRQRIVVYLALS